MNSFLLNKLKECETLREKQLVVALATAENGSVLNKYNEVPEELITFPNKVIETEDVIIFISKPFSKILVTCEQYVSVPIFDFIDVVTADEFDLLEENVLQQLAEIYQTWGQS